jgi:hypothetical protein
MCRFVTAVLPASADAAALDALVRSFGRRLLPIHAGGVRAHLREDERYFLTTLGHCDCDTSLGTGSARDAVGGDGMDARSAKDAERLRRKGWSDARIARSLASRSEADARAREQSGRDRRVDAERWRDCLQAVLASGHTDRIALLLHDYSGALDCPIDVRRRETIDAAAIAPDALMAMREDVLYEFRR